MIRIILPLILFFSCFNSTSTKGIGSKSYTDSKELKDGDIIFQSSDYGQSKAIQLATNSIYSHVGIIFIDNEKPMVYEAVQPVKITPLNEWITHGKDNYYAVKRLKENIKELNKDDILKMKLEAKKYLNYDYDLYFEWDDKRIYCSEYVWKIYKQALGIEIGEKEKLKDFDLRSDIVKHYLNERYGQNIPMDEDVVSPVSIFNSDKLELVKENGKLRSE